MQEQKEKSIHSRQLTNVYIDSQLVSIMMAIFAIIVYVLDRENHLC